MRKSSKIKENPTKIPKRKLKREKKEGKKSRREVRKERLKVEGIIKVNKHIRLLKIYLIYRDLQGNLTY
jgi:hypothetical protein